MTRPLVRRVLGPCAGLVIAAAVAAAQSPPGFQPFASDERRALLDQALKSPRLADFAKSGRVRALSVVPDEVDKDGTPRIVAVAVLVNYGTGRAVRVVLARATRQVEDVQPLSGRPQSSAEERAEAEEILRRDSRAAPLIKGGGRIDGGFVVDAPAGQPAGRYLEFHVVSPDGTAFVAEAVIDLGRGQVAVLRDAGAEGGVR